MGLFDRTVELGLWRVVLGFLGGSVYELEVVRVLGQEERELLEEVLEVQFEGFDDLDQV